MTFEFSTGEVQVITAGLLELKLKLSGLTFQSLQDQVTAQTEVEPPVAEPKKFGKAAR